MYLYWILIVILIKGIMPTEEKEEQPVGMEIDGGEVEASGGTEDDEMQELMQNKEFLESVLSSLPGVNAEEALQNLQEMTKVAEEQQKEKEKKDKVKLAVSECNKFYDFFNVGRQIMK